MQRHRDAGLVDAGRPGVVTYSRKVFVPLTRLCRDRCHYCTFATVPGRLPSPYLSMDEVLDIAREQGARQEPVLPMFLTTKLFGDLGADYIVSKLLSFQTGQPTTFGRTGELCSDLRAVAAGREAVVVTTLDPAIVRRLLDAQHCDVTAGVVQLPGLDADLASQSFRVGLPQ